MQSWPEQKVQAAQKRSLAAVGLALALVLAVVGALSGQWLGFFTGPRSIGNEELARIGNVDAMADTFVRVTGTASAETGLQEVEVREQGGREMDRRVKAEYYLLAAGEKILLVKIESGKPLSAQGELRTIPLDVERELFPPAARRAKKQADADPAADEAERPLAPTDLYPFYLDATYSTIPWLVFLIIAGAFALGLLVKGFGQRRVLQDPARHKALARVASWGKAMATPMEMEREFAAPRYKLSGWRLGNRYLIRSSFFTFDAFRTEDLVWAYLRQTKHRVYFVPVSRSYAAVLQFKDGAALVAGSKKKVEELLALFVQRVPWAMFGYNKDLEAAIKKDGAGFVAFIDKKRADMGK